MLKRLRGFACLAAFLLFAIPASADQPSPSAAGNLSASCSSSSYSPTSCPSGSVLWLNPVGISKAQIQVAPCSASFTLYVEASLDGAGYSTLTVYPLGSNSGQQTISASGIYTTTTLAGGYLQVRATSWSGSSCHVTINTAASQLGFTPNFNSLTLNGFADGCLAVASGVVKSSGATCPFIRASTVATVAADGGTTNVSFSPAFASSVGPITLTPAAYSGTDNAFISCRVTTSSVTGFSCVCGGGQTGSTVTLDYFASGV